MTHHHADHTDGIAELKKHHKCRVVAPHGEAARIPLVDETVRENDTVRVGALEARVIETPGHTAGHISYFFPADKLAFVGDTLFSIGCGRVIEGTPEMMWQSLLKLRALPDDTSVYCGHEYTQANIRFAKTIEPANAALAARAEEVDQLIAATAADRALDAGGGEGGQSVPARRPAGGGEDRSGSPASPPGRCLPKSASARTDRDACPRAERDPAQGRDMHTIAHCDAASLSQSAASTRATSL